MRTRSLTLGLMLFGVLALGACSEAPTSPDGRAPAAEGLLGDLGGPLGGLLGVPQEVTVLKRSTPLPNEERVAQTIGSSGGTIYLPRAGLTITIPRDALSANTTITVTAPAGNLMGYHFEPHGLAFARPVTLKQSLSQAELGVLGRLLSKPTGAYFLGELRPTVSALELLPLDLNALLGYTTFEIEHFSGYVIATD
jgi:hypothetical protein